MKIIIFIKRKFTPWLSIKYFKSWADLCENQITVKSLNDQLGSEFVSKYQTLERTLRRMENYQHQHRANLVQMTEEIKETGLSDESRENLSDQEDYWYHNQVRYFFSLVDKHILINVQILVVMFSFKIIFIMIGFIFINPRGNVHYTMHIIRYVC